MGLKMGKTKKAGVQLGQPTFSSIVFVPDFSFKNLFNG